MQRPKEEQLLLERIATHRIVPRDIGRTLLYINAAGVMGNLLPDLQDRYESYYHLPNKISTPLSIAWGAAETVFYWYLYSKDPSSVHAPVLEWLVNNADAAVLLFAVGSSINEIARTMYWSKKVDPSASFFDLNNHRRCASFWGWKGAVNGAAKLVKETRVYARDLVADTRLEWLNTPVTKAPALAYSYASQQPYSIL